MLYDKLKPHIEDKLKSNAKEYSASIDSIFNTLKQKENYSELIDIKKKRVTFKEFETNI